MKTIKNKTKAFAFLGAAFVLLIALTFTACPQTTGSGSGSSGGPTVKLTVTGDTNINLPAEAVAVRVGSSWQQVRAEVEGKVSAKAGFLIDSWRLGADTSAPEIQDTDAFFSDTTVFVKSRPDLPDLGPIQGGSEQVKITLKVSPEEAGSILEDNPISVNKGTTWPQLQAYAKAALKVNYGFNEENVEWKQDSIPVGGSMQFNSDAVLTASPEDLRINITVTGDSNVTVAEQNKITVMSGTKWKDIKTKVAEKVTVDDPKNFAITAWKRDGAGDTTLSDTYEFKKTDGQERTVHAETGSRRITLTVKYGTGSGTAATAGSFTVYDGDTWSEIQSQAAGTFTLPQDFGLKEWHLDNAGGAVLSGNYIFKASEGNARTVFAKTFDKHIRLTVKYVKVAGGATTAGTINIYHGNTWNMIRGQAYYTVPASAREHATLSEWRLNNANGDSISDDYIFKANEGNEHTVYALIRPDIDRYIALENQSL